MGSRGSLATLIQILANESGSSTISSNRAPRESLTMREAVDIGAEVRVFVVRIGGGIKVFLRRVST